MRKILAGITTLAILPQYYHFLFLYFASRVEKDSIEAIAKCDEINCYSINCKFIYIYIIVFQKCIREGKKERESKCLLCSSLSFRVRHSMPFYFGSVGTLFENLSEKEITSRHHLNNLIMRLAFALPKVQIFVNYVSLQFNSTFDKKKMLCAKYSH